MNTRPRLLRSIPFWALLVGSIASIGFGLWMTVDKLGVMTSTLTDGTATGVEVYVGQSWVVVAAAFIGAGLVGLVAVLALVVARSLVTPPVEVVEAIAWQDDASIDEDEEPETAEPEAAAEDAAAPEEPADTSAGSSESATDAPVEQPVTR